MGARLILGNCLDKMKALPDASVDLVLCDLPYGTTVCKWDVPLSLPALWAQYRRIAKEDAAIVLTASQPFTSALGASALPMLRYSWVWEKGRATDFLNASRKPLKGFEDVLVFYRRQPIYNPQDTLTINLKKRNGKSKITGTNKHGDSTYCRGVGRGYKDEYTQTTGNYPRGIIRVSQDNGSFHPTQKPVALMEYLIRTYTNEGATVLDNCMGSGSTGVACVNTGRHFIGMELNPTYYATARQRITEAAQARATVAQCRSRVR